MLKSRRKFSDKKKCHLDGCDGFLHTAMAKRSHLEKELSWSGLRFALMKQWSLRLCEGVKLQQVKWRCCRTEGLRLCDGDRVFQQDSAAGQRRPDIGLISGEKPPCWTVLHVLLI